jgi:hypothetical protein
MVTFRSNSSYKGRRPSFRSNNNRRPPFRRNDDGSNFSNNDKFSRNTPAGNNHNAAKLIEKYNDLAREALASEDKILSESYFQYADHFTRVLNEQEKKREVKVDIKPIEDVAQIKVEKKDITKKPEESKEKKLVKPIEEKLATS